MNQLEAKKTMKIGHEKGIVLEIQRMSTEDGPGIRTTVFMKGCPLRCAWCHNPESIDPKLQIQWIGPRCIGCKLCIKSCPSKALHFDNGIKIDLLKCNVCGLCANICPSTALEIIGKVWEVDHLLNELLKDRAYFETSKGGVTISGGESTYQSEFVLKILMKLKQNGIHTAIDTCGLTSKNVIDSLIPYVDLILYDIKEIDPLKHEEYTGVNNNIILENLVYIIKKIDENNFNTDIWIRTPLIPGKTATDENITGIAIYLNNINSKIIFNPIKKWDLCAFNNLCKDKYKRLGRTWEFENTPLMDFESLTHFESLAKKLIFDPSIVNLSGSARIKS